MGSCLTARVNIQHYSYVSVMLTVGVPHTVWTISRPLGLHEFVGERGSGVLNDHPRTAAAVVSHCNLTPFQHSLTPCNSCHSAKAIHLLPVDTHVKRNACCCSHSCELVDTHALSRH